MAISTARSADQYREVLHSNLENPGEDIEPDHLPRLFDRFYRVDPSRQKAGSDGAGLGLAITKSIIDAHEASIRVSSANGLTRFTITFPAVSGGC